MKKCLAVIAAVSILAACGNNNSSGSGSDSSASGNTTTGSEDISSNPDYQKGLALVGASDCLTCHRISEKLVGPSYQDVANKYTGVDTAVTYLAHRIISGVGANETHNWGSETNNGIMTPHPQVTEADAEQMVKYVLLLKTK